MRVLKFNENIKVWSGVFRRLWQMLTVLLLTLEAFSCEIQGCYVLFYNFKCFYCRCSGASKQRVGQHNTFYKRAEFNCKIKKLKIEKKYKLFAQRFCEESAFSYNFFGQRTGCARFDI